MNRSDQSRMEMASFLDTSLNIGVAVAIENVPAGVNFRFCCGLCRHVDVLREARHIVILGAKREVARFTGRLFDV